MDSKCVWIVEEGDYEDYHVVAIFSTEEKANEFCNKYKGCWHSKRLVDQEIPVFDKYSVIITKDFNVTYCDIQKEAMFFDAKGIDHFASTKEELHMMVDAKSKEEACKLAIDIAKENKDLFTS